MKSIKDNIIHFHNSSKIAWPHDPGFNHLSSLLNNITWFYGSECNNLRFLLNNIISAIKYHPILTIFKDYWEKMDRPYTYLNRNGTYFL